MAGATRLGSNHYETLGLRPDASAADIERAFRNELHPFMPHVVGGVAAASVAYATLRDPEKRRAYDVAHGFAAPPPPTLSSAPRPLVVTSGGWQMGNATALRTMPPLAAEALRTPELECEEEFQLDQPPIAPPEAPAPRPEARAAQPAGPPPFLLANDGPRPAPVILGMDEAEDVGIGGRKGMLALGAVAAVALAGGLLGWVAGSDADEANVVQAVSPLPKAEPRDLSIITPVPATTAEIPALAAAPIRHRSPPRAATKAAVAPPPQAPADDLAPVDSSEPVADSAEAKPESAAMPLSNATVARTIDRIGYRCGSVSATESAGGGVFDVTCSSGQRFRAAPRNGRYRFKRL